MYLSAVLTASLNFLLPYRNLISMILFFSGILIVLIAGYQFRLASTTVNPLTPDATSTLVTSGLYKYSRNPMYVGFLIFLIAWGVYLANLVAFVLLPLFVLFITRLQIIPEEQVLKALFSEQYSSYASKVRRWI